MFKLGMAKRFEILRFVFYTSFIKRKQKYFSLQVWLKTFDSISLKTSLQENKRKTLPLFIEAVNLKNPVPNLKHKLYMYI